MNDAEACNLSIRNSHFEQVGDNPTGRLLARHPQTTVNPQNFHQITAYYPPSLQDDPWATYASGQALTG
eukprot:9033990-Alexandrium_andersonii.AAC.1